MSSRSSTYPDYLVISRRNLVGADGLIHNALPADIMEVIYKKCSPQGIRNFSLMCKDTANLPFGNEIYKFKLMWPMLQENDNNRYPNWTEEQYGELLCVGFLKPTGEGDQFGLYNISWTKENVWNSSLFQAFTTFFFDLAIANNISLRRSVRTLETFRYLNCSNMRLTSLPGSLSNLTSLTLLYCQNNPGLVIPDALVNNEQLRIIR